MDSLPLFPQLFLCPAVLVWLFPYTQELLRISIILRVFLLWFHVFVIGTNTTKAAFTRQTKVGKLVLANSSWCMWTAQKQSANTFYLPPTVCQCVCRLFLRPSHTATWVCQHEFANFSLPREGRLRNNPKKRSLLGLISADLSSAWVPSKSARGILSCNF